MLLNKPNIQSQSTPYIKRIQRLKIYIFLFLVLLLLPLSAIIYYGYQQLEHELYFDYQWKTSNIVHQINKTLKQRLSTEEMRPVEDYQFYTSVENPMTAQKTKSVSPLSMLESEMHIKGLIGYFEISSDNEISSPILPSTPLGKMKTEFQGNDYQQRKNRLLKIKQILAQSDIGKLGKIKLEGQNTSQNSPSTFSVNTSLKNALIFHRSFTRNDTAIVQGFIVDKQVFLIDLVTSYLKMTKFDSELEIILQQQTRAEPCEYIFHYLPISGNSPVVTEKKKSEPLYSKTAIYRGIVNSPFINTSLIFNASKLPFGPSATFIAFFLIILTLVIFTGCFGFYWLSKKQIDLIEQRMNFVSSVSHELKTPLTSILMYADMLRTNMVNEDSIKQEYHQFIFDESERLARLINNVLQLSKLNRQQYEVDLQATLVSTVLDLIRSKTSTLISNNHFELLIHCDQHLLNEHITTDLDALSQIMINLVDNSIKFFNSANITDESRRKIDVIVSQHNPQSINIQVRDFGPGINSEQEKKVFELFYRGENELTRTTTGTGIGLALSSELMQAQHGTINVTRHTIGVSFTLLFAQVTIKS